MILGDLGLWVFRVLGFEGFTDFSQGRVGCCGKSMRLQMFGASRNTFLMRELGSFSKQ